MEDVTAARSRILAAPNTFEQFGGLPTTSANQFSRLATPPATPTNTHQPTLNTRPSQRTTITTYQHSQLKPQPFYPSIGTKGSGTTQHTTAHQHHQVKTQAVCMQVCKQTPPTTAAHLVQLKPHPTCPPATQLLTQSTTTIKYQPLLIPPTTAPKMATAAPKWQSIPNPF